MTTTPTAPPPSSYDEEQAARHERARKRVEELRGFYVHVLIYLVVNTGLFLIDLVSGDGWWFYWVLLAWGIGLGAHAVSMLEHGPLGRHWEERKIAELMRREDEATRR